MADTVAKKKSATKAKKPRTTPSHPKVSEMVIKAVADLKERSGSSLQAIKKYIASKYKVDAEKIAPFIRKYLKTAVASGALIQTKGKGASGSFKLGASKKVEKKSSAPKAKPKAPGIAKEKQKAVSKVAKKKAPKAKKPKQKSKKVKKAKAPKPKKAVKASKSKTAPKQSAA